MRSLRERLASGPPIVADGATGSLLQSRGHAGCLERLVLESPETVREVHRDYLEAGAEMLWTNSFGGSPGRLESAALADRTEDVNEAAARLAREVARGRAWVVGSIGPCGALLAPLGDLDPERFARDARRQIEGLRDGGVDAFAVETMIDVEEAVLAVRAVLAVAPGRPVLATCTFEEKPGGLFTPFGQAPADVARRLADAGADAIGANCGTGPEPMVRVASEMRDATALPLLFKPNAGMPRIADSGPTWPSTPEIFAEVVAGLTDLGAAIVGGCCGTGPDHIRALRARLGGA
jgi:5-methyltetrahydrofolate--homocysteine methyltransferase